MEYGVEVFCFVIVFVSACVDIEDILGKDSLEFGSPCAGLFLDDRDE